MAIDTTVVIRGEEVTEPEVRTNRIHERVRLRDVAALLHPDQLVDVVARMELVPDGPQRVKCIEYFLEIDADAYTLLKAHPVMPRAKGAPAASSAPPSAGAVEGVQRLRAKYSSWQGRYAQLAEMERAAGLPNDIAARVASLCTEAVNDLDTLLSMIAEG